MSPIESPRRLQLPESLHTQLHAFRRRVWGVKAIEAAGAAAFGVTLAYLLVFLADRCGDTPPSLRLLALAGAGLACGWVPWCLHRWIWRYRRLDQLARLLSRAHPQIGDQLLGIIELVRSDMEQARSLTLCQAAVQQVARAAQSRDFRDAVPAPRHRVWTAAAAVTTAMVLALAVLLPGAAANAWARLLAPWKDTPRFTFAAVAALPERIVVPHGESFTVVATLQPNTLWRPNVGRAAVGRQPAVESRRAEDRYEFEMPAQLAAGWLSVRVGDWRQRVWVEPALRPELTAMVADVALPDYLGRPQRQKKDVRGGAISLVNGSLATFSATVSRELSTAHVDGQPRMIWDATVSSPATVVDGQKKVEFRWQDCFGLAGKEPFTVHITGREDEPPSLACEELPRQKVLLDSEQLAFKAQAQDDFGIKCVGMEWRGIDDASIAHPAKGERVLGAGGHDRETLELAGTFCAKSLGIEPQPIQVRIFAEDYLPGRARVYWPACTFYVLDPQQHAMWLTEQLSKWHRMALEVRDREMQLHETNKELRSLPAEELDRAETRRRIENQAAAERANARRLANLATAGEDLVRQAMRNPEIGVGHLEKWAEMLRILQDISAHRMPSVADRLKEAAQARPVASTAPAATAPMAGQVRAAGTSPAAKPAEGTKQQPPVPRVADVESSLRSPEKPSAPQAGNQSPSAPRLGLPGTMVSGSGSSKAASAAGQKMDDAVTQQRDLLAEFEKIADELNRVLANLEGSTLVKRLKAAARIQYRIGGRIGDQLDGAFGKPARRIGETVQAVLKELSQEEAKSSQAVSLIMDDMQGYFERRRFVRFKTVLDEMRKQDAIGSLRQLGDDLAKEHGLSMAQCDYWSDTLDRWADDLVDPTACGQCPGSKSRSSLPPSIVLEVMQILEGEVNLREETRVAEQAKPAWSAKNYTEQAGKLASTQHGLKERMVKVAQRIAELPDGAAEFHDEIQLLGAVAEVMTEAAGLLARPDTGRATIAAETEAIELLLQSRRFNPRGGGGGGSAPGGGGRGTTNDPALALLGVGVNEKEVREDHSVSHATGEAGPTLPEEFRAGLDQYFDKLERSPGRE